MQMDEGHSMTPPVANTLLSESCMEAIEGKRQLLLSIPSVLLIEWSGIEE